MSLLDFLVRRRSAPIARERLQILLAHERGSAGQSDLVMARKLDLFKENIGRFMRGEPMLNVVDKDKGY